MATKKTNEEKLAAKNEKLGNSTMGGWFLRTRIFWKMRSS